MLTVYYIYIHSVLRVTYDTSAKKICRVEEALNALMDKFNQEHIDALALSQQGNAEAQRRVATLTNLLRILTHTADKVHTHGFALMWLCFMIDQVHSHCVFVLFYCALQLSQKWHNIVMYKKYLIGVQDLCMLRKLGKGSFASVYLARMVDTQQMYAVKVLSKHHVLSADLYQQVMMERTAAVMASRYEICTVCCVLSCCVNLGQTIISQVPIALHHVKLYVCSSTGIRTTS